VARLTLDGNTAAIAEPSAARTPITARVTAIINVDRLMNENSGVRLRFSGLDG
jgi:hypothetical protein